LGFTQGKKAFLLYDRSGHHVIQSHNVKFDEGLSRERIMLKDNDNDDDIVWVSDKEGTADDGDEVDTSGVTWVPRMRIVPPHHPIHLPLPLPLPLRLDVQVMSDGPLPQMTR
jgi:hypothetical protein